MLNIGCFETRNIAFKYFQPQKIFDSNDRKYLRDIRQTFFQYPLLQFTMFHIKFGKMEVSKHGISALLCISNSPPKDIPCFD